VNTEPIGHTAEDFPVDQWQKWASPVWMDVQQTNTLNVRAAREVKDEKHICPLQLDLIERCLVLWSRPGDVVFSPFTGIGSEGVMSIKLGRKFLGTELKESYWKQACGYIRQAESESARLL
jgi:DNA modification methylase